MAVVVDAFDVVVRVDALPDGVDAFASRVPNVTFCTDGKLARASFMTASDRDAFFASLGLESGVAARVDRNAASETPWIEVRRYAGVHAAWLRGTQPEAIVVPVHWRPDMLLFRVEGDLEYVGRERGVEVYRDKRTGAKLYTGRTQPAIDEATRARLDAQYKEASGLVSSFVGAPGKRDLGFFEKRRLKKGIDLLEAIARDAPAHWPTLWLLGMALRAALEHTRALDAFRKAYALAPTEPDVGRELAGQCMIAGQNEDAVRVSRELHARFPHDVSLHSNLALALLLAGKVDESIETARAAHAREPGDVVTKNLVSYAEAVRVGNKARPTRMPGW